MDAFEGGLYGHELHIGPYSLQAPTLDLQNMELPTPPSHSGLGRTKLH